jgi:hypothetical protein
MRSRPPRLNSSVFFVARKDLTSNKNGGGLGVRFALSSGSQLSIGRQSGLRPVHNVDSNSTKRCRASTTSANAVAGSMIVERRPPTSSVIFKKRPRWFSFKSMKKIFLSKEIFSVAMGGCETLSGGWESMRFGIGIAIFLLVRPICNRKLTILSLARRMAPRRRNEQSKMSGILFRASGQSLGAIRVIPDTRTPSCAVRLAKELDTVSLRRQIPRDLRDNPKGPPQGLPSFDTFRLDMEISVEITADGSIHPCHSMAEAEDWISSHELSARRVQ